MTTLREAAQQALEALLSYEQYVHPLTDYFGGPEVPREGSTSAKVEDAITALRAALAEPVQEPVVDAARVIEWATGTPRKAAVHAFTEGPERQAAYWIEWAEARVVNQRLTEPVAWMDIASDGTRLSVRMWSEGNSDEVPLYLAPPQRKESKDE